MRPLYLLAGAYIGLATFVLSTRPADSAPLTHGGDPAVAAATTGAQWFRQVKASCNTVEVEMLHRRQPPPDVDDGPAFSAACYALAGKVDRAAEVIDALPTDRRWRAAGVVFNVAHPIADMGDDESAGPIMEMVVRYWPNHYMALYHAGMSRYALGDAVIARRHLTAFLEYYPYEDGWTKNAHLVLERLNSQP